ncbi:MAG: NAD(P)-dependent glycerol-3-phosphate dehydrogenase [Clostridia bacterium]|nr:NAD(P)-dependent glycerol-3-phosphate dehydrogenase [Clostridia bacterium]
MATIGILGAGTWGSALAKLLYTNGHAVSLWSAIPAELQILETEHRHPKLPGVKMPDGIRYTASMEEACRGASLVVFATPSVYIRSVAAAAKPYPEPDAVLISVAKGIEPETFLTMTEVIAEAIGCSEDRLVALSGPTHAEEVSIGLPTAIVSAGTNPQAAELVQRTFSNDYLRTYTNADVRGVELCGALKNIIALAAGISDGIGYGDNAKAAIITRGMVEIARLGAALGCDRATFYGLAGVGDLIVTATSRHSRNNRAGYLLGAGYTAEQAVREVGMVVEGLNALPAAIGLSKRCGVEMPITAAVDEVVRGVVDPRTAVNRLMNRTYKTEV